MNDSEKELTIDELVEEINTFPPFDPEELTGRLENPIYRRMFFKGIEVRRDVCKGEIPIPEGLKEVALLRAEAKRKQKTSSDSSQLDSDV